MLPQEPGERFIERQAISRKLCGKFRDVKPFFFEKSNDLFIIARSGSMSIIIYGIKNCDTMKKARRWLDTHGVAYDFHDYKAAGLERARIERWCKDVGWEALLNRAGTTFRKLPDADKQALDEGRAKALMLAQPSLIKRPVLEIGGHLLVGFKPELYERAVRS